MINLQEVNDTKDALQATEWELQELKGDAKQYQSKLAEIEQLKKQIAHGENERYRIEKWTLSSKYITWSDELLTYFKTAQSKLLNQNAE